MKSLPVFRFVVYPNSIEGGDEFDFHSFEKEAIEEGNERERMMKVLETLKDLHLERILIFHENTSWQRVEEAVAALASYQLIISAENNLSLLGIGDVSVDDLFDQIDPENVLLDLVLACKKKNWSYLII